MDTACVTLARFAIKVILFTAQAGFTTIHGGCQAGALAHLMPGVAYCTDTMPYEAFT